MRVSKLPFKVIDVRTGREYSEKAVIKDGYTDGLMEMDLDGFMICEDGHLALGDECGRYNYVNTIGKYEIEIEGYIAIDEVLEIIDEKHDDFRGGSFRDNSITYMQAWKRSNEAIREAVGRLKGGKE